MFKQIAAVDRREAPTGDNPVLRPECARAAWKRYGLTAAAVLAAVLLRLAMDWAFHDRSPLLIFSLAVMVSAFYGGLGAGLVATALAALCRVAFWGPADVATPDGRLALCAQLAVFVTFGVAISLLAQLLHRARQQTQFEEAQTRRLLAEAQEARAHAETAQQRAAFLAEAGAMLASSLDYQQTMQNLARLAVPRIADFCLLFEKTDTTTPARLVACAHVDSSLEGLLPALAELWPRGQYDPRDLVRQPTRSGQPVLVAELSPQLVPEQAGTPAREQILQICRQLAPKSLIVVPLAARGQVLGVAHLLTSRSASNRTYTQADLELAEELARGASVAVDNARLYRAAQQANAAKDQFLAVLSHELRTPLTPVLFAASALAGDASLPQGVRDEASMIRQNVELEARLIDDLLDLTRISRGKLAVSMHDVDAHQVIHQAVQVVEHEADAKDLRLELELSARQRIVRADAARLQQVFWNLLINAIKFTPQGGRIRLTTGNAERPDASGGADLIVQVQDSGIGIDARHLPRIFNAFDQGETALDHRYGGLGLGLTISRALLDLHGGSIQAASAGKGRGTTFTIRLPALAITAAPAAADPCCCCCAGESRNPAAPASRALKLLLVEDHQSTAKLLARLLRNLGHQVQTASTVQDALHCARSDSFDLVISDLGLPDGTGLDLMRQLADPKPPKAIALSGYGTDEDRRKTREAGFLEHLTKPVDLKRLQSAITRVAGQ